MTQQLQTIIDTAWEQRAEISPASASAEVRDAVAHVLAGLDDGSLRVAQKDTGSWVVNQWIKKAVLLSFRLENNVPVEGGGMQFYDKVPTKFANYTAEDFAKGGFRVVPPAVARRGSFIGKNVVLMPSYVNIGAYVDEGAMVDTWATVGSCAQIGKNVVLMPSYVNIGAYVDEGAMVDTWATVGSCAQIGKNVHLSGGVGIGGVLEPMQANPTIIEDNCFIGARSEIVEGVIVEENSVISMGVYIGQSTKIYNRETGEVTYGRIPAGSVVVSGSLPSADGKYSLYCAVIVKQVDAKTRAKTGINELLRGV
jgi:2,3,4,5-tetrahydropyridine-2-carboxylate N-succinyltransferase